jgi:hypothetical protein
MERINKNLVASCGMDCGVCSRHLRAKNQCNGCNEIDENDPKPRSSCQIRVCQKRQGRYCYECEDFPCDRLEHLDKRYQEKYGMSQVKNLEMIRDRGMDQFIKSERKKYQSAKGIKSVHDNKYY